MYLSHLGVLLTTFCNLNCRDCADLIPKRKENQYEIENVKKDLEKILSVVDYIGEILLIGGEVMLYKDLSEIIEFCGQQDKIRKIYITTNGTIVPSDEIIKEIQNNNVTVRVSGYPKEIAPKREEVIRKCLENGIEIEDLQNMTWLSMGKNHKRNRDKHELERVFYSCLMKNCVGINRDGILYYCSRQVAAYESVEYPVPKQNEYVNIRKSNDLEKELKEFFSLKYITTCDYCDGISCKTKLQVPTAIQIMKKDMYLKMIRLSEEIKNNPESVKEKTRVLNELIELIREEIETLVGINEVIDILDMIDDFSRESKEHIHAIPIYEKLMCLINRLSDDYCYIVDKEIPYHKENNEEKINKKNRVTIGLLTEENLNKNYDILLSAEEIEIIVGDLLKKIYSKKYNYNRIYIQGKLNRIEKENIENLVAGLSYTQYGIIENQFSGNTVNLSITGIDMPYTILLINEALKRNSDIKNIIIPCTFYHYGADISKSEAELHKYVMQKILYPILKEKRNFKYEIEEDVISGLYSNIFDLDSVYEEIENQQKVKYEKLDYFNEDNHYPKTGGLKFDFLTLNEEERKKSARITAKLNEQSCNEENFEEIKSIIVNFLEKMQIQKKNVLFFVPPMTTYLFDAYSEKIKTNYYEKMFSIFKNYSNVTYIDLSNDDRFLAENFCDFEHLNFSGAEKLTSILNEELKNMQRYKLLKMMR